MASNTIFRKGKMVSTHLDSHILYVKAPADLKNGSMIEITGLVTGESDLHTCTAPSDVTADQMYIVDAVPRTLVNGKYAIDLADPREFYTPLGYSARARRLAKGDTCYVSTNGFASAPTVGQYAVPANGVYTLAPAANLSGSTLVAFKVIATENFYVGSETVVGYKLECVVA